MAKSFNLNSSKAIESIGKVAEKSKVIGLDINRNSEEILIQQLEASEKNFYSLDDIEDLKESIRMFGVLQPLLVEERREEGIYKVIAGHRRLIAAAELGIKKLPCIIKQGLTDIDFELMLIHANKYRVKSDMERAREVQLLVELIRQKKGDTPSLSGRTMELVANELDISLSQAKRLNNLNKLIPEIQEMLDSKKITASSAEKFSSLSVEEQKELYETILNTGKQINNAEADELRSKYKELQNQQENAFNKEKKNHESIVNSLISEKETEIQKLINANKLLGEKITKLSKASEENNEEQIKSLEKSLAQAEKEKKKLEKQIEKEKKTLEEENKKTNEMIRAEISRRSSLRDIITSTQRACTGLNYFLSENIDLNDEEKKLLNQIKEVANEILAKLA